MKYSFKTISKFEANNSTVARILIVILAVLFILPTDALALSKADKHAIIYGTPFYDETPDNACAGTGGDTTLPSGPLDFPKATQAALKPALIKIRSRQAFYQEWAKKGGVPWELLAALGYREDDNNDGPGIDPQNGEVIGSYPYTNKDNDGTYNSYEEVWQSVYRQIKTNHYDVKIPPNGALSADDVAKIGTSWRYGEKLVWNSKSNIPKSTTYLDNSYAYSGMDAARALNTMPIIHWDNGSFIIKDDKDDRLGIVPIYLSLTGGGFGSSGTGCVGGPGDACVGLATPPINNKAAFIEALKKFEAKRTQGKSPLVPHFGELVDGAVAAGWNPMLVLAQANHETQMGTDTRAIGLQGFNAWGRTAGGSQPYVSSPGGRKWYKWASWTDALTGPDNISVYNVRKWITEGKMTTIDQLIMEYAPPSDGNDTQGYIKDMYASINEIVDYAGPAISCGGGSGSFAGFRSPQSSKLEGHDTILPKYGFTLNVVGGSNMTYYAQADPRWGTPGGYDIASGGCGPTSMAMIVSTLTKKTVTPTMMVPIQGKFGGLVSGGGTQNGDSVFVKIGKYFGLKTEYIGNDLGKARKTIMAGGLVIASTNGNDVWSTGGHYIVIRGITADNRFLVANSNGRKEEALTRSYTDSEFSFNFGMTAVLP